MEIENSLQNLPVEMHIEIMEATLISRTEPCRLCGSTQARLCAPITYWDLQELKLVDCPECHHTQLDPMLSDESLEVGCLAYYIREISETSEREQKRNLARNFRRGVLFASHLKSQNIHPQTVLEFGPGSGYFLAGMQFIFPDIKVTVVDIVDDVLKKNKEIHGFSGIKSTPDRKDFPLAGPFDLIIARDIIEHVSDFSQMLKNIHQLLKPNGYFHFITPNGREDSWGHRMQWALHHQPSELLINHVNYFDGAGLLNFLEANGFKKVEYYTYQIKGFFKGKGWKKTLKWSTPSVRTSSKDMIKKSKIMHEMTFKKSDVLSEWYIQPKMKWLTIFYSWTKHVEFVKLNPSTNIGHEILGTFQKK